MLNLALFPVIPKDITLFICKQNIAIYINIAVQTTDCLTQWPVQFYLKVLKERDSSFMRSYLPLQCFFYHNTKVLKFHKNASYRFWFE